MNNTLKNLIKKTPPMKWLLGRINKIEKIQKDEIAKRKKCINNLNKQVKNLKLQNNELKREMKYLYYKGLHPDQYASALIDWYYDTNGQLLDLDNPQTYNEKIQWLKLYDTTPIKARLADKYFVREWVAEKIGEKYLIPLLGVYDRFDDINFDELPDKFVIKTNHACAANQIVTNKSQFDIKEAREFFKKKMRMNFAFCNGLELQYRDIPRKIIIEEYLENADGNLYDYKFWCFDGKVQYIMFLTERREGLKMVFYDREWNRLPFVYSYPQYEGDVEKPDNLSEMIVLAEKLAAGFSHVRVDFYRLNDGTIKFGEMTFTSASGTCNWVPSEYNKILGDHIKLPIDKK